MLHSSRPVTVISPAGKVPTDTLDRGVAALQNIFASVRTAANVTCSNGQLSYLAAPDALRAADIMTNAADGAILWAARGGYGCARLLDMLDWERLQQQDFAVAGFSDITALHWAMCAKGAGEILSVPMLKFLAEFQDTLTANSLAAALDRRDVHLHLPALRGAAASGTPLPGNLSVAASLAGTKYFPDAAGKIVILEDVNEPPYRIDRALTTLRLAGLFDRCAGVVFGSFTPLCAETDMVLADFAARVTCPVFSGLAYSHELPFYSLSGKQQISVTAL